eukprot:Transcript_25730.p3 GENE.Transcript_25730~~Transcript_25730.p3  ORF type:complete len:103 (-),score=34.84 Transcript_25730:147-455(-)
MFRLLIAALCLSAASAYSGAAAPAGKTTVFTGSKNAHIYRTATPSQAAPMLVAQPKQARSEMVYMSGTEEVVQYEMFDPIKLAVWIVPFVIILIKTNGIGPA